MTLSIAFTSCMDVDRAREQPVWDHIGRCANGEPPDLLLLLGDQIYMDWGLQGAVANVPRPLRLWNEAKAAGNEAQACKVLDDFAQEMHQRYTKQWEQPQFKDLMQRMRAQNKTVAMVWDDHDFAWNNAMGLRGQGRGPSILDNESVNDKVVPPAFKQISLALRSQFMQVLCNAPGSSAETGCPSRPDLGALMRSDCALPDQKLTLQGVDIAVLDQRWHRTDRDAVAAQLLSEQDRLWLREQLARKDAGLLILAGSSPLKHRSITGAHGGWWAPPDAEKSFHHGDRHYPEFEFLRSTQRPVLYLGGDIHRNAWGGYVELPGPNGKRPPLLQALSSGAAIGGLLNHKYAPSYGVVQLVGSSARDVRVSVALNRLEEKDDKKPTGDLNHVVQQCHRFTVADGALVGWVDDGECTETSQVTSASERLLWQLAQHPLPVLAFRAEGDALLGNEAAEALPRQLDSLTLLNRPAANPSDAPSLFTASSEGPTVLLRRPGPGEPQQYIHAHWDRLFAQAKPEQNSVVLFVHGFGKGFFEAASQATELRLRYPKVKTGLYTWPSTEKNGMAAALSFGAQLQAADQSAPSLATAVATFCQAAERHADVRAVLVVRSLGAVVLAHAAHLLKGWPTHALKRVVLSAPACDAKRLKWMNALDCEVVATVNQNDRKLGLADWVHNGPLLGHSDKRDRHSRLVVLDCTKVPGIDRAHDYLLRAVNQGLFCVNETLLAGLPLTSQVLQAAGGLAVSRNGQVWSGH